ncbi:MAG TPA: SdpI family protein [Chryseolinea sp.]|nr:SdpI family protein [Chryseolinea sp.]
MNFLIPHLLIGPVLLLLAALYKTFPPRKINNFYGYRTARSMGSMEAWNEANHYSARLMLQLALLLMVVQLATYWTVGAETSLMLSSGFLVLGLGVVIYLTERHLKQMGY